MRKKLKFLLVCLGGDELHPRLAASNQLVSQRLQLLSTITVCSMSETLCEYQISLWGGHSHQLPHHLLKSLAVDLWDESRAARRLRGSRLRQASASIDGKVLQLLTPVQFNRKYWHLRSQQSRKQQRQRSNTTTRWARCSCPGVKTAPCLIFTLLFLFLPCSWMNNK